MEHCKEMGIKQNGQASQFQQSQLNQRLTVSALVCFGLKRSQKIPSFTSLILDRFYCSCTTDFQLQQYGSGVNLSF